MTQLQKAILLLKEIKQHNHQAYIVGGFVRDYLRGIQNPDIDICTSMDLDLLKQYFKVKEEHYGSTILMFHGSYFEVTTFRREIGSKQNRYPEKIIYTDTLEEDLKRRDFRMNAICMNEKREIIDPLGGKDDVKRKQIVCIGDPSKRLEEDALRILRAIRFATTLNFSLDSSLSEAIIQKRDLLKAISYQRKKEELNRIFSSSRAIQGRTLLIEHQLLDVLEIPNLKNAVFYSHPLLIWMQLGVDEIYPFTKEEKKQMKYFRKCMEEPWNLYRIYESDLQTAILIGMMKGKGKEEIKILKNNLPIQNRQDIKITSDELQQFVPVEKISYNYKKIEQAILTGKLKNKKTDIIEWLKKQK